jgi:hypothetical protein
MVKEQRRFGIPDQLGYFASEHAVWNFDPASVLSAIFIPSTIFIARLLPNDLAT